MPPSIFVFFYTQVYFKHFSVCTDTWKTGLHLTILTEWRYVGVHSVLDYFL